MARKLKRDFDEFSKSSAIVDDITVLVKSSCDSTVNSNELLFCLSQNAEQDHFDRNTAYQIYKKIIHKINDNAFKLNLPIQWKIHNSFHISLLKPFRDSMPITLIVEDPPFIEDDAEILIPERILDHDVTTSRTGIEYHRYLIKYKNHSIEESQWIQQSSLLPTYKDLIAAYHHSQTH